MWWTASGTEQRLRKVQLGWIPEKRCAEIVYKYRNVRAQAGVYWNQEEFSRGYSFPVADALHCITGKKESCKKYESFSQNRESSPSLYPQPVFSCQHRASLLIMKENWGSHAALLGCWASPSFGVIPEFKSESFFCHCCSPLTLPEEHREPIKVTTLLPGNCSALPGIFVGWHTWTIGFVTPEYLCFFRMVREAASRQILGAVLQVTIPQLSPRSEFPLWASCLHRNITLTLLSLLLRLHGALGMSVDFPDWEFHVESEPQSIPSKVNRKWKQTSGFIQAPFHPGKTHILKGICCGS